MQRDRERDRDRDGMMLMMLRCCRNNFCSAPGAALSTVLTIVDVAIPLVAALAAPIDVVNAIASARDATAPKPFENAIALEVP